MKTILAILFFAVMVSAQEKTTKFIWDKDFPNRESNHWLTYSDIIVGDYRIGGRYKDTTYISVDFFAEMALSLWQSYQKECTAEYRFEKLKRDSVWVPPCSKHWREWLEKKPTFEGFMQYLKKQIRRK